MKTILLKFAGPLQSWGTNSHFETRHTDFYPSKSAVIGLISASLGYKRIEDDKIQKLNELNFAVRIDQEGNLLRDYHTARKFDNKGKFIRTYVTNRYYLEDAIFIVGISHEDNAFMEMIENSLKSPYFQPYMGRRSLPVLSQLIFEVNNMGLLESIKNCDWQAAKWYKRKYKENKEVDLEIYLDKHQTS